MIFSAEICIEPLKELLDPQGKAVETGLKNLSLTGFSEVRIGKLINLTVEAESEKAAREKLEVACKKLLANPIIESYRYSLKELVSN